MEENDNDDDCYRILQGCRNNNINTFKFYNKDCLTGMAQHIEEKSVDVAVTSPPYNNRTKYNSYQDDLPRSQYLQWIESAGISIKKVLADDGSFFLNIGNRPTDQWTALDVSMTLRKHFVLQNRIIWFKSIVISKEDIGTSYPHIINADIAPGHFKPINSPRYLNNCYEDIFHFTKDGNAALDKLADGLCVQYQDKSNIGRYAKEDRRDRGNTWFIPYEKIQSRFKRPHPATFPVKLPQMCIKLHGLGMRRDKKKRLVVLDPFCGIGSTAIACMRLGVSFIGFDIDQGYLDEAISR